MTSCRSVPAPADAATCTPIPADESGTAYWYAADGTGACSFDASPNDLMVAAMNSADYDHAAWCGACLEIIGPNAMTLVVRVVDECEACAEGDLELSVPAFTTFAPLAQDQFTIGWHEVACDVTGPIAYRQQEDTTASWAAFQIRNARYPIATLEAQAAGGGYTALQRGDDNYFVAASGLGPGPFALRTTDARGQVLLDTNIALAAASVENGESQFPTCGLPQP